MPVMDTPKETVNREPLQQGAVLTNQYGHISSSKLVAVLMRLAEKCGDRDLLELLEEVDLQRLEWTEEDWSGPEEMDSHG